MKKHKEEIDSMCQHILSARIAEINAINSGEKDAARKTAGSMYRKIHAYIGSVCDTDDMRDCNAYLAQKMNECDAEIGYICCSKINERRSHG